MANIITDYLVATGKQLGELSAPEIAHLATLDIVAEQAPDVARSIIQELQDQRTNLKLIASENFCSPAVQFAMGNCLTDKYAEGAPGKRFYAGCENVDDIEDAARLAAVKLFGVDHAYVQPHSGADANLVAFLAVLHRRLGAPALAEAGVKNLLGLSADDWGRLRSSYGNQRLLGMDLAAGGHLTHGYRLNISAVLFDVTLYGVIADSGLIDYSSLRRLAKEVRPLILLVGYSAYPRKIDFSKMREIADESGAVLIADMAHFAGLVAGQHFSDEWSPVGHAQIITSTTHKTLRGPRGGLILCESEFAEDVDKGCPYVLGGPMPNVMAAKAVCLEEAAQAEFQDYAAQIVRNAQALADEMMSLGMTVVSGGTDNHLVLADVRPFGLTGRQAESALRAVGITLNRNMIPGDTHGPWYTSGLRFGTAAVTTLGMGEDALRSVAQLIQRTLAATVASPGRSGSSLVNFETEQKVADEAGQIVSDLLGNYPLYPDFDTVFLEARLDQAVAPNLSA